MTDILIVVVMAHLRARLPELVDLVTKILCNGWGDYGAKVKGYRPSVTFIYRGLL